LLSGWNRYLAILEKIPDLPATEETSEAIRDLIESASVRPTPPYAPIIVDVTGKLAKLLGVAVFPEAKVSGEWMVAGEGFEPPTPGL
jgi:hypothetical protein